MDFQNSTRRSAADAQSPHSGRQRTRERKPEKADKAAQGSDEASEASGRANISQL